MLHDGRAEVQAHVEQLVQAQLGDTLDLPQRFGQFIGMAVLQAPRKGGDDVLARQTLARRALDGQDEGKAELGVVLAVEALQGGKFVGAAQVQAGLGLFARRLGRQLSRDGGLAGQFGVGADESQLFFGRGQGQHALQFRLERRQAGKRPRGGCALGDPGRMFVDAMQLRDKIGLAAGVQV